MIGGVGGMYEEIDRIQKDEDQFADLIEAAFLAGLIDGQAQELAYLWLAANYQGEH